MPLLKKLPVGRLILIGMPLLFCAAAAIVARAFLPETVSTLALAVPLTLIYVLSLYLAFGPHADRTEPVLLFGVSAILAVAFAARLPLLSFCSDDYYDFLKLWIEQAAAMPGASALGKSIGNYNAPYFYILWILGKLTGNAALYYLKLVSVCFDVLLAYAAKQCIGLVNARRSVQLTVFVLVLFLPTVLLNGAYWAQCDSIYTSLALLGLYHGWKGRGRTAAALFGLALAFKLQTVFLMPVPALLLLLRRIRIRDLWAFFAVFFGLLLPAILCGRPFAETVSVYLFQTKEFPQLSLHAPSVFGLFNSIDHCNDALGYCGILLALASALGWMLCLYLRRSRLDAATFLDAAFLISLVLPFLLPHMHERYFFAADILSVLYAFSHKNRAAVPALVVTSSLLCYFPYLFGLEPPVPLPILTLALGAVIVYVGVDLARRTGPAPACELPGVGA